MHASAIYLHALTPLHAGTGQGNHVVDLPVVREVATGWPFVPGSTVKGVYAAHWGADQTRRANNHKNMGTAFGRQLAQAPTASNGGNGDNSETAPDNAGSLMFTDLRILALPVRSLWGTFAWITCPSILKRWQADLDLAKKNDPKLKLPALAVNEICAGTKLLSANTVVLEDLELTPKQATDDWAKAIAEQVFSSTEDHSHFQERFAVVHDDVFNFLCQTALEIRTRIKINPESGIVATGQLWTEEALPSETILQGLVCCETVYGSNQKPKDLLGEFCKADQEVVLQIGGKASTGKGLARVRGLKQANHTEDGLT